MQVLSNSLALRVGEPSVTFRGDAEAGAAITLIDRWDRGPRVAGSGPPLSGLVRFPPESASGPIIRSTSAPAMDRLISRSIS